jgi:uncharacterized protein YcbX
MATIGTVQEIWRYPVKSMVGERLERTTIASRGLPGDRGWALRDEAAGEIRGGKKLPALMRCTARYLLEPGEGDVPPAQITFPDGSSVTTEDPDVSGRLSAFLGRTVTIWPLQPAEDRDHYRRGLPDKPDLMDELRDVFGRLPDEPLPDLSVFPQELFEFTGPLGTHFDAFPLHLLTTASLAALGADAPAERFDRRRFRPNLLIASSADERGLIEAGWSGKSLRVGEAVVHVEMPCVRCSMTTQAQPDLPKDPLVLRAIVREGDQNLGAYATVTKPGRVAVGDVVELL